MTEFIKDNFSRLVTERQLALGREVVFFSETTSTNDIALQMSEAGAAHGLVVVAGYQSHGRGRHGNIWHSPMDAENLLFSVLLRIQQLPMSPGSFTLSMGLAVRDALRPVLDREVLIKWPNDIWVDDKKLAGILVESRLGSTTATFVVGVGLNVAMRELPEPIGRTATSLALLTRNVPTRERLLADILEGIERRSQTWLSSGLTPVLAELRHCDALLGRKVTVDGVQGYARGIDDGGALLLQTSQDQPARPVLSGTVEIIG